MYRLPQKKNIKLAKIRNLKYLNKRDKLFFYKDWYIYYVNTGIFNYTNMFCFPKREQTKESFDSFFNELVAYYNGITTERDKSIFDRADACNKQVNDNLSVIFLLNYNDPIDIISLLCHEITHSVNDIFDKLSLAHNPHTEEIFTHTHQYIYGEFLHAISLVYTLKI